MRFVASLVIGVILLAGAGTARAGDKEKDGPRREEHRKKLRERFDKDGDGKLSLAERQAAKEAMKEHRGKGRGDRHPRRKLLERFDKDGDGKLSDAEKQAAREAMKEHREKRGDKKPR